MKNNNEKKVVIFDVSSLLHRIYHAKKAKDDNVNLLNPFIGMVSRELSNIGNSSHFVFVFDGSSKENFRSKIYPEYKANRPPSDPLYVEQKRIVFSALKKMGAAVLCQPEFEADDIIGFLSKRLSQAKIKNVISTKDKDLFCLVNEHTKVFAGNKRGFYGVQDVFEEKGVFPYQMTDFLTMVGDTSDNILGIDGVGEKTAAKILSQTTFDEIMQNPDILRDIEGIRGAERIIGDINHRQDEIWFMKSLVELRDDINIDFNLKNSRIFDIKERNREMNLSSKEKMRERNVQGQSRKG